MTPREGVSVDDPAEREAFAAHMRKRHAYEYVYWNGAGQPSAKRPDTPYGEGWVPCDEQWAAWLGRASLAHPAATAREGALALLKEARDGLQLDADERKQQLASLSVARPGMFDALVYNDAEIKRNRALVARIDEALAHPAATAMEEAFNGEEVMAVARAIGEAGKHGAAWASYDKADQDGLVEMAHAAIRALALARSTGGN